MHRIASFLLLASAAWCADAIYVNGTVITVDPSKPYAEAFAVTNGRFSAVGSNAEIRKLASPGTKVVDLKGMTVTPGFNDVHLHPTGIYDESSPYYTPWLGPEKVHNMDELIAALKAKADKTPKGQLVSGTRYQDTKLGRHPTRYDLDKASTEHPISISHSSGHIIVVNSYILNASGITKETKDPPGGSFDRDPDGTPNGVIREAARGLLRRGGAGGGESRRIPWEAELEGHVRCFRIYAERGITSAGIAGGSPESFRLYEAVRDAGGPVRMGFMYSQGSFSALQAIGLKSGFGDDRLRMTSIKVFHGNSMSGRTCWLSEEYSDQPGYFGIPPARSQEALDKAFAEMHKAGFQIATHSNGDREIDMVLTAIDMGIHVAGHSDSTVSAADPLLRIQDMVTRKGENGVGYGINQRIGVEEAIKVWTLDGAYATFEEQNKGSIATGKLADFAVLRKDPRKVPPDHIKDIVVDATYVGGKNVWQAPANAVAMIHHLIPGIDFGDGDEDENLQHDQQ